MRILVQRVFEAWVKVGGVEISRTKQGLLVLVGITHDDTTDIADHMVSKILNMRLWEKDGKTWNGSVLDLKGDIMMVSQFTLYGMLKGNKPDFHASMEADKARDLFNYLVSELKRNYFEERIQTGKFQALMEVGSVINGPVTIEYEKLLQDMPKKKIKPIGNKVEDSKQGSKQEVEGNPKQKQVKKKILKNNQAVNTLKEEPKQEKKQENVEEDKQDKKV